MSKGQTTDIPWVEKYRPKNINEVAHQDAVKRMLKTVVKTGNMPHCLFHGPPGTGKTSAALALCKELFGEHNWKRRVFELNASDDRGINVIRDTVKSWTRTLVVGGMTGNKTQPEWKIVILDEADMMTSDAQSALRRIMEDNAKTTRFIIICNYLSRIIDPIASRCAKYRFEPITQEAQLERLILIAKAESINITEEGLQELLRISEGDLRISVTMLQTAATLIMENQAITPEMIHAVTGFPPRSVAEHLIQSVSNQDTLHTALDDAIKDSWDTSQLMRQILEIITSSDTYNDLSKARIITALAEAQFRLTQGASEYLQLCYLLSTIHTEYKATRKS